jgi:steroid 5-alpha reductase family enzyme
MFSLTNLFVVSGFSLLCVAILMTVTAVVGRRQGRVSVVDTAWGLGFVVVAAVAAALGDGPAWRRVLLLVLVAVWGGRLAWHVTKRNAGKGEDPRYERLLADQPGDPFFVAIRKVYLVQGAAVWFVSLPLQVSAWIAGSGRGPGTRTTSATPRSGGVSTWLRPARGPASSRSSHRSS